MVAKRYLITCLLLIISAQSFAQQTQKARMPEFMDQRFGMFVHFGPITLRGTEIGWSRNKEVAQADYDSLYKEFNPVLFNADNWVKAAKDAGIKYLVITAKHHDGFCLWPTKLSDYNIMNSPFKRDIVGELAKACKKQGMIFGIYCTVLDWHDKNYPIQNPYDSTKNVKGDITAFKATMKGELKELITKYDPYLLWFDGYWEKPWTNADGREIYYYIKSINPNILVNNRLGKVSEVLSNESVGDYLTPEQRIGQLNMNEPWESCITICQQWAWKPNDQMKSLKECIQTLVKTAAGNGNLLFNVGPMMDGRIEGRQVTRLKKIGDWMKTYGSSIYNTKGGPFVPNDNLASTRKGSKIYIHVFKSAGNTLTIPTLPNVVINKATLFNGEKVEVKQSGKTIQLTLPDKLPDDNDNVVILDINQDAEKLPVIKA
ncbi:alpha-L-fucosidase [Mucilaginibacter sp.]|uniref:alpha-L-fucosidase n=1 Tax=Mucilaginibacter sp. TaxID=1882438 RepID=UPI003262E709